MGLIDADALQRKICGAKCGCEYEDCGNEGDCEFAHFIFWAPTVDAEPIKYGEWIDGAFENSKSCSVCGRYATKIYNYNELIFDYVVCPYCGAKMKEWWYETRNGQNVLEDR